MQASKSNEDMLTQLERRRVPEWQKTLKRFLSVRMVPVGLFICVVMMLGAVFADFITPYDYDSAVKDDFSDARHAPTWDYWFGTDHIGRDVFSRIIYGTRISGLVSVTAIGFALFLGTIIGLTAGYFGKWLDSLLMRAIEVIQAFPFLLLGLVFVSALGSKLENVILAISILFIPGTARVIRSESLSVSNRDYVTASRALGATGARIMVKHIFPQVIAPGIVISSLGVANAVILEASLSFLGLGVPPPHPSWGGMLRIGYSFMDTAPWLSVAPGLAIVFMVVGVNFLGDGIRDATDPRLRR